MDLCASVNEAFEVLMAGYADLSVSDILFEEDNPEVAAKQASNAEIEGKAENLLMKAIGAVKKLFKTVKDMISNAISYLFAGKDEKVGFDEMCRELQNNPEFAGKKITFRDYRQLMADYNKEISNFENEYKRFKGEEAEGKPNLMVEIEKKMKDLGQKGANIMKAEGKAFTIEAAIAYAKQSQKHAARVNAMIEMDERLLGALEAELGKKNYKKFKHEIRRLKSRYNVLAVIARARRKEAQTIQDAFKEVAGSVRNVFKVHRRARKDKDYGKDVRSTDKLVRAAALGSAKGKLSGTVKNLKDSNPDARAKAQKKLDAEKGKGAMLDSAIDIKNAEIQGDAMKQAAGKLARKYGIGKKESK